MHIRLYHNNSLSNVVNKSITVVADNANAKFLDPYDEYAPVIRYRGKWNFDDVNYICIDDSATGGFDRYYYLEDVEYRSPQIAILHCRLDVLMTYKFFIESLKCYLVRSGNKGDLYLPDNRPCRVYNNVERLLFKDSNNNTEGFVVPNETPSSQCDRGTYILYTLQRGYTESGHE